MPHAFAADFRLPATVGQALRQAAQATPDAPFLRMPQGEWSYAQIHTLSDHLAAALQQRGIASRDVVTVLLPNCPEFVVTWMALSKLGAVTAPVNTSFKGQVLQQAVDLVQSRVAIVHASLLPAWEAIASQLAHVQHVWVVGEHAHYTTYAQLLAQGAQHKLVAPTELHFSDLNLLLYTSGTTGRSKAAMISHRFVLGQAHGVIRGLGLRTDDVLYCPYPLFHLDAAVMTIAPALLLGAVAAIGERFSVSRYWTEVRDLQATVFDFMGATLTMLWKQPASDMDRAHRVRLGWGVPLPTWAPEFEARFGCKLVELYGCTEAGTFIYTPQDAPVRPDSCGTTLPPWETALLDADGFAVPTGAVGELVVRSREPSLLMAGYFGMPEASLHALRDGWFHTGDLLRQDADGYYYFVGRTKDMVRRRGENISAAEVEMGIEQHPAVQSCAVFGVPSEMTEEEVMACVVLQPGSVLTAHDLADFCAAHMAKFMVPRYIRFMSQLPKTPTDKIEKFRLKDEGVTLDTWDRERLPLLPRVAVA